MRGCRGRVGVSRDRHVSCTGGVNGIKPSERRHPCKIYLSQLNLDAVASTQKPGVRDAAYQPPHCVWPPPKPARSSVLELPFKHGTRMQGREFLANMLFLLRRWALGLWVDSRRINILPGKSIRGANDRDIQRCSKR